MRSVAYRGLFAALVLVSVLSLGLGYLDSTSENLETELREQRALAFEEREPIVAPRDDVTVVTTSPRETSVGELIAYAPDGRLLYYNNTYKKYFDVEPSPAGRMTVAYVAMEILPPRRCGPVEGSRDCILNVVERVNLTTGETTRVFDRITHGDWHDVDRLSATRYLVADIVYDRPYVLDVSTGVVEWGWDPKQAYPISSGGVYPSDWTHMNDVEALDDGRIMVSLRNQDQVVFVDRERGLEENWTLGAEDDRDVLNEQHNPDYIPPERGGPAVLVGDSENNRVVEYQRENGEWVRTWVWRDARMRWPRDADRLPNGHTLITDSNGNRILEVDRRGEVVWSVAVDTPYEAERLGTGDGSTGGESARSLDLASRGGALATGGDDGRGGGGLGIRGLLLSFWLAVQDLVPSLVLNGLLFVLPAWMEVGDLPAVALLVLALLAWAVSEARWRGYGLRSPLVTPDRASEGVEDDGSEKRQT